MQKERRFDIAPACGYQHSMKEQTFLRFFKNREEKNAQAGGRRLAHIAVSAGIFAALGLCVHLEKPLQDAAAGVHLLLSENRAQLLSLNARQLAASSLALIEEESEGLAGIRQTVPDDVILEWYGGQAMDRDALRRTIAYVTVNLKPDGSWSTQDVHNLLMETAAVETELGTIVRQQSGPALSVWQILGFNFVEIREYFAKYDPELLERAMAFYNEDCSEEWNRIHNIPWTAAITLLFYEKASRGTFAGRLGSLESRGQLWKKLYNTRLGKGTVQGYINRARQYVHTEEAEGSGKPQEGGRTTF